MADRVRPPILFLDVDGPLLPFGREARPAAQAAGPDPYLARLDPTVGPRLAALGLGDEDFAALGRWLRALR
jgi:hypothetical protein